LAGDIRPVTVNIANWIFIRQPEIYLHQRRVIFLRSPE